MANYFKGKHLLLIFVKQIMSVVSDKSNFYNAVTAGITCEVTNKDDTTVINQAQQCYLMFINVSVCLNQVEQIHLAQNPLESENIVIEFLARHNRYS